VKETDASAIAENGPLSCLILCGGKSGRMGRPKAFLPYNGTTMIAHILEVAKEVFDEVLLIANEPEQFSDFRVNVVKDILPYRGPLGGLLSGLLVATNQRSFVLPCDMPFISQDLLKEMSACCHESDVLVLSHSGIKPLEEALFAGAPSLSDFVSGLNAKTFDCTLSPEPRNAHGLPAYFNVDTPQDYCLAIGGLTVAISPDPS
jgi:molybdopterin-guanine dinucleotide biosynthesis protein A